MLITVSGKGGVGKTTITALLVDELLRHNYPGRLLVVDADPAQTLHLALGVAEPEATLAQVRDTTPLNAAAIRGLPEGSSPAGLVWGRLANENVIVPRTLRGRNFDLMAMGHGEGAGCYCAINSALSEALNAILENYDAIIVDNEAGLEHLSRYRIKQVDLFLIVVRPGRSAQVVGEQVQRIAEQVGMQLLEVGYILNQAETVANQPASLSVLSHSLELAMLDQQARAAIELSTAAPQRFNLLPVVERIEAACVCDLVP